MLHTSTLYLIESQIELAEKIAELSGIPDARVFFANSGSEANDAALMLATAYRRSNQVLAMRYSYHGRTFSAVPVTGNASWSPSSLSPFMVNYLHGSYPYRSPFRRLSKADYIKACTDDLEEILNVATAGDVACLIAEPILGVGGFAAAPDGLFGAFQEILKKRGILFISDEVQTGWGRTGEHFWGYQSHGAAPDIMTFAKGLGNGLAIGGVIARAEIMNCWYASSISTFGGNPLSTRGALANLAFMEKHDLQKNAAERGAQLRAGIEKLAVSSRSIGEVRGKGLMLGVEFVEPGGMTPNPTAAGAMLEETRARGLLIGKGGHFGNVSRIAPPMTITADEIEEGLEIFATSLAAVEA
jgi:4-aminobutyrate aminotransferase